jgi:hypothetical protein
MNSKAPKTPTKTADRSQIVSRGKVAMAVLAVIGTSFPDSYDDVDDHPGSLDLATNIKRGRKPATRP